MRFQLFSSIIVATVLLSGCATSKRGAKQDFIVKTVPIGAKVETTILEGRPVRLSQSEFNNITNGEKAEPELTFLSCEPTPCAIKLPRKIEFDILVSKDGYTSRTYKIDHFHRKEIAKEVQKEVNRNTVVAGTGAAVVGAGMVGLGVQAASFGTASASTGALVAGAAAVAAPVIGIGLISMGVDSGTGANYDYWPNPVAAILEPIEPSEDNPNADIHQVFDNMRRDRIIRPRLSAAQARAERKQREEERTARLQNNRLFKDYAANPTPEPASKPQSGRRERRLAKKRQQEAEAVAKNKP